MVLQGIVGSGLMVTLMSWVVRMKGPLFVSIFNPLMLVLVALAGSLLLEEKLYLGRYCFLLISIYISVRVFIFPKFFLHDHVFQFLI